MTWAVVSSDPHHPLIQAITSRLQGQLRPSGRPLPETDSAVVVLQTPTAVPLQLQAGGRPLLEVAPWHLALPPQAGRTALLRHGPLFSELRHHDESLSLQRLLLWPYGPGDLAWLADDDLLAAIAAWIDDPWEGERRIEGPEAFSAQSLAEAISQAIAAAGASPQRFASLKFQACDRDADGRLDDAELRATLLHAGVSSGETSWALKQIGRHDGLDAAAFSAGVEDLVRQALQDETSRVQAVVLEAQAAAGDLLQHGWIPAAAEGLLHPDRAAAPPPPPAPAPLLLRGATPLSPWLETQAVAWIPIEILPTSGVLSRRVGRSEGQSTVFLTYRLRDGRIALMQRSADFSRVDLRWQQAPAGAEPVRWSDGEQERILSLLDQRLVAISVRGHWPELNRAESLLISGEPLPHWMVVLFKRSGQFQLQQEVPRSPSDLICRCAHISCSRVAELMRDQAPLSLATLVKRTRITTVCGGCRPALESWLEAGGSMPPSSAPAAAPLPPLPGGQTPPVLAASPDLAPITDQRGEASAFLEQCYGEQHLADVLRPRLAQVEEQLAQAGGYHHTYDELAYGARLAWRNSTRCLGRQFWHDLDVRDRRDLASEEEMFAAILEHIRAATHGGDLRSTITVFRPDGRRIWNPQFCRYAGYRCSDGSVLGDPMQLDLTEALLAMGWDPGERSRFDLLPLVIQLPGRDPRWFPLPTELIQQVPIRHPRHSWFEELDLRWYALPAVSNMAFDCGGIQYTAAPFNGFYMGTEIGARNFADTDRYNQLPLIAERLGLDTSSERSLWRDLAVVELNVAVLHSFEQAGVRMADHHSLTHSFMAFAESERRSGRLVQVEPRYAVPPISASLTPTFSASFDGAQILKPNFFFQPDPWLPARSEAAAGAQPHAAGGCPFQHGG